MKKLLFITLLTLSFLGQAQRGGGHQNQGDYTPEQRAVLKTKKMALHLDLNKAQQDQLLKVNRSWAEKRAERKEEFRAKREGTGKPDPDERYAFQVQMLDNQMKYHNEIKKILNDEQYAIWKEHQSKNRDRGRHQRRHSQNSKKEQDKS